MKKLKVVTIAALASFLLVYLVGCTPKTTDKKEIADDALSILKSLRGAAGKASSTKGESGFFASFKVDSFWLDETKNGVQTQGWLYWDDNNTPSDTSDDIYSFRGKNVYLDWNYTENWFMKVYVDTFDRRLTMSIKNVNTAESLYVEFGKVSRPGGLQSGPGRYCNTNDTLDVTMGIHHANTPNNWDDNYSYLEFLLFDYNTDPAHPYWVHADFRPANSGSGEIHDTDGSGDIIATFEWDEFGRGTLVVGGDIYPFKW